MGLCPGTNSVTFDHCNFPPGSEWSEIFKNAGVCPHFELLLKAQQLLIMPVESMLVDEYYCGEWHAWNPHDQLPIGPYTECQRLAKELLMLIQAARPTVEKPVKPGKNGHVIIKCKPDNLESVLADYARRIRSRPAIDQLTKGAASLKGEGFAQDQRWVLALAEEILTELCLATMGVEGDREICAAIFGHIDDDAGCRQRPKKGQPTFVED